MPELPEVEGVRRTLEPCILGISIVAVEVARPDFVTPANAPLGDLIGKKFTRTFRHGKKLFCIADDDQTILIHLGMSGRVDCVPSDTPKPIHTHITISLGSGTDVRLRDPRRFGGLWYYRTFEAAKDQELKNLGPDALDVTPADLAHWRSGRGRLKQKLLAQSDIAGLGNIYVDESLWLTQLHPLQRVDRLSPDQIKSLVKAIHKILGRSIAAGGTTLRDYRNVSDQPGEFARNCLPMGVGASRVSDAAPR